MRTWPGLAAIGAGLIHLGISAGSAPLQLALFALAGAAEALWGVVALARPAPRPAASLAGAAVLVVAQLAVLLGGGHDHGDAVPTGASAAVPLGAVVGATLLDLGLAALLAVRIRRGTGVDGATGTARFLVGAAVGAAAVAVVTASSLTGTALGGQHLH